MSPARPGGIAHRQLSVGVAAARHPRPQRRRARGDRAVARTGRGRKIARVRGAAGRRACGPSASGARNRLCPPRSGPRRGSRGDAGRGGRVGVVVGQAPAGGDRAAGDAATTTCLVEAETPGVARRLQSPGIAAAPPRRSLSPADCLHRGASAPRTTGGRERPPRPRRAPGGGRRHPQCRLGPRRRLCFDRPRAPATPPKCARPGRNGDARGRRGPALCSRRTRDPPRRDGRAGKSIPSLPSPPWPTARAPSRRWSARWSKPARTAPR